MKAAYVRVSSKAQNLATQRDAIERIAAGSVDRWFEEKKSGKNLARPVLDEVRAAVRAGSLRKLYVYRLDRLTRSGIRDTFEVVEELRRAGVQLVSASEPWLDLAGPFSDVILAVMAWAAQMERLAINERIASARERVEGEGGAWGRPGRGHTEKDKARGVVPLDLAAAKRMRAEGRTIRAISVALKVPRATLARCLKK